LFSSCLDQINWKENATAGNANTVLYGDPSKPGLYIVLVKWHEGPTHFGKQVHYDGAKEGDTVLEIVGEGPATSTPAEQK
jgi:hypothetical protein